MKPPQRMYGLPFALLHLVAASGLLQAQERVNPDALLIQDFGNRVTGYMRLHDAVKAELHPLKPTSSAAAMLHHEHQFAHKIREARHGASQGNLFTPEIAAEFRRLIGIAMQGQDATRVKQSLRRAEPVRIKLHVNHSYPAKIPLQSTPPTLLLNLPKLPPELDYRVVAHDLVLRDASANLIVDLIPNAVP